LSCSSASTSLILVLSSVGLGPIPSDCAADCGCVRLDGAGVPLREGGAVLVRCLVASPPGGVDAGRVVICKSGMAFMDDCGNTSSRLMGIPREIRCCRRMRERIQSGGLVAGGYVEKMVWNITRLCAASDGSDLRLSGSHAPLWRDQCLVEALRLTYGLV